MTCEEFKQRVDALLSGDVTRSGFYTKPIQTHLETCPDCTQSWRRVAVLCDALEDTDADGDIGSEDDIEVAVLRAREGATCSVQSSWAPGRAI